MARLFPLLVAGLVLATPLWAEVDDDPTCIPTLVALEGHMDAETTGALWNAALETRRRALAAQGIPFESALRDLTVTGVATVTTQLQVEALGLARPAPTVWVSVNDEPFEAWLRSALALHAGRGAGHRLVVHFAANRPLPPRGWLHAALPRLRTQARVLRQSFIFYVPRPAN